MADVNPGRVNSAEDQLKQNIQALCLRLERGRRAAQNPSVKLHGTLGIASIILSSLGGAGVIADRAFENLQNQTGWAFWAGVCSLAFGILSQIANQFGVAQRAADSKALAVRCGMYGTRLDDELLINDDPQAAVKGFLRDIMAVFQTERYNVVLPAESADLRQMADEWAGRLIRDHQGHWQLQVRKQKPII